MMENIIVGVIVLAAVVYVGNRFYKQFFSKSPSCECAGCGKSSSCGSIKDSPDNNSKCNSN
ncbi:MAG: FeoB-associated Cys-rich membrane protein [Desulfovibrio sp.]|nr:FeoB-associated Cys-rich membrane protein [Desulfovibrio sp.]